MNFRAYYCCLQACKTRNALSEKNQAFFTNFFSIALDGFDVTNLITYCTKYLKKKQKKLLQNIENTEKNHGCDSKIRVYLFLFRNGEK